MSENKTLNANQRAALKALAEGMSNAEAAEATGITERTIQRYRKDPDFQAALKQLEDLALKDLSRKVTGVADEALDVVLAVMRSEKASGHQRLRAAEIVIKGRRDFWELVQMTERLESLEDFLGEKGKQA